MGIGIGGVLFIVFLVLKLCNLIAWSWWWVTAQIWLPFVFILAVAASISVVGYLSNWDKC